MMSVFNIKNKHSAPICFSVVILITLISISNSENSNASYPLDLTQRNKLHQYAKRSSLSETSMTSTVRPWPSAKFFNNVLAQSKKRNYHKVGQHNNSRSHNQKLKTPKPTNVGTHLMKKQMPENTFRFTYQKTSKPNKSTFLKSNLSTAPKTQIASSSENKSNLKSDTLSNDADNKQNNMLVIKNEGLFHRKHVSSLQKLNKDSNEITLSPVQSKQFNYHHELNDHKRMKYFPNSEKRKNVEFNQINRQQSVNSKLSETPETKGSRNNIIVSTTTSRPLTTPKVTPKSKGSQKLNPMTDSDTELLTKVLSSIYKIQKIKKSHKTTKKPSNVGVLEKSNEEKVSEEKVKDVVKEKNISVSPKPINKKTKLKSQNPNHNVTEINPKRNKNFQDITNTYKAQKFQANSYGIGFQYEINPSTQPIFNHTRKSAYKVSANKSKNIQNHTLSNKTESTTPTPPKISSSSFTTFKYPQDNNSLKIKLNTTNILKKADKSINDFKINFKNQTDQSSKFSDIYTPTHGFKPFNYTNNGIQKYKYNQTRDRNYLDPKLRKYDEKNYTLLIKSEQKVASKVNSNSREISDPIDGLMLPNTLPFRVTRFPVASDLAIPNNMKTKTFNRYKIKNKKPTKTINTNKQQSMQVLENSVAENADDKIQDLHHWIENENVISVTPSSKLPNFTSLKWPYRNPGTNEITPPQKNSSIEKTLTTERSQDQVEPNFATGFQLQNEMTPSLFTNPTTTMTSSSKNNMDIIEENPGLWQRVPIVTSYPVSSDTISPSSVSNYISSGIKRRKPVRTKSQTASTNVMPTLTSSLTNKHTTSFHQTNLIPHVAQQILEPLKNLDADLSKSPQTNIWYKPIINHFTSQSNELSPGKNNTELTEFPLVFKVWKYKNDILTLENEKEIPGWALKGFKVKDGAILNLDEIPLTLQNLISSAIIKNNNEDTNIYRKKKRKKKVGDPKLKSSLIMDNEKNKPNINYVILDKEHGNNNPPPITISPELQLLSSSATPTQSVPTTTTPMFSSQTPSVNYLDQYLHVLTTVKPHIHKKVSHAETWNILQQMMYNTQLGLSTPVQYSSSSAPSSPNPQQDSIQSEQTENGELLANLAAIAILISYTKHQSSTPQKKPTTIESSTQPTNSDDFNSAMHKLFEQLLNKNALAISSQRVKVGGDHESYHHKTALTTTPAPNSDKLLKTLLLQGSFQKGNIPMMQNNNINKKRRKKRRRGKKKSKTLLLKKKKKKFMDKFMQPMVQLMKKPKQYWFDVKFDVDIFEIMKKKFFYILALKYAPIILILALGLIPLGIIIIPLLVKIYLIVKKIYWVKKKPKYIRVPVPVPVPKPYPVYPYHHEEYPPPEHDHQYAADSSGPYYNADATDTDAQNLIPNSHNYPLNDQEYVDERFKQISTEFVTPLYNSEDYPSSKIPDLKPHAVTHAYEFGFDLGSKLGSMTNQHDKEVLSMLLDNKKDKINKLLERWKLIHKGKSMLKSYTTDPLGWKHRKDQPKERRRKRKS